nr:probable LRR receptor-like serine/threonine-protein kinase At1g53430 [Ipomoea batatas]
MEKLILLLFLLLLFALNSQITMGEGTVTTTGPISKICTEILNLADKQVKPLGTEDENAIINLLGCSQTMARRMRNDSSICEIQSPDIVTCDCSLDMKVCRVTEIGFTYRSLEGELPDIIGSLTNLTLL